MTLLILGGTGEARTLAAAVIIGSNRRVVSSLAGRVSDPLLPAGEVRLGGFGGPDGLAAWMRAESVTAVVDATHPFAARISASAVVATRLVGTPLLVLRRPGWQAEPGDDWTRVADVPAAAAALMERDGPVFLTTGRGGLAHFANLPHRFVIRTVDPPDPPLPADAVLVCSRGPYRPAGERALLAEHGIRVLVTKDSGGEMTSAKLTAARELGVPVVMVDRPPLPDPNVAAVADPQAALAWVLAR
ncbi:MAG TPA: cobalt-precorrin-6A reductase [Sporichthyaceae bacterium]|jgi:precorrin-6A/cobalt-precorrin-6A reductase